MDNLEVFVASSDRLEIRQFSVREGASVLFTVSLIARSRSQDIDFDAVVGKPARFVINSVGAGGSDAIALPAPRVWAGVCNQIEQISTEERGLATYSLSVVPSMWLLTQRRNYRMFQQMSEPAIALRILAEWGIEPEVRLRMDDYKARKYKVQYAETDFAFVSRVLEEAGITYYFHQEGDGSKLVLSDAPQTNEPRRSKLPFVDSPQLGGVRNEYVTGVRVNQQVRPGKYTMRDHDFRKPADYRLVATASGGQPSEQNLESYHYTPGAFLFGANRGEETPSADDKGRTRVDEREGAALAQKRLDAKRSEAKRVSFETNALDLAPGAVIQITRHPRADLDERKKLLVLESVLSGSHDGAWAMQCEATSADVAYRPSLVTARPKVSGVESATVVGPPGEEIHTDEFGRVRVHFHWDRESRMDDNSSCWLHVSQPWAGSGYGATNLPRVGQEVLVDFLGGDPERPIITGRVYTNLQKTPYKLPENKTQSGWRSQSTGGTGGYNEILFEDKAGQELVSMRAERDLNVLVKRSSSTRIGEDRSISVGGDDREIIGGNQRIAVGKDREVHVGGRSDSTAGKGASWTTEDGDTAFSAPAGTFLAEAQRIRFEAAKTVEIMCGESQIVMTGGQILLRSPSIQVNPGAPATAEDEADPGPA